MIAKMHKAYVAVRSGDRDRLLSALREAGVLHLKPVDPARAVAEERTIEAIAHLQRARQILAGIEPAGEPPKISPRQAAEETLRLQRQSAEKQARLSVLFRQLQQLAVWGDVRLEQFEQLRGAGVEARFFSVPTEALAEMQAELVAVLHALPGKRSLVAVVDRAGQAEIPEAAQPIDMPQRDRPTIRAEAADIEASLKRGARRRAELANLLPAMEAEVRKLRAHARYTVAGRGGLDEEHMFAVQGWVPAETAPQLGEALAAAGLDAAVEALEPAEDEEPPTLIRYPRWATPIKGLFDLLGTLPGYREFDVSAFFMIALPAFAAVLIGDAGYGLVFVLLPLLLYRKAVSAAGPAKVHLLIVVGAMTIVWGLLSGNIFGVSPGDLIGVGGVCAAIGGALESVQLIRGDLNQQAQMLMKVSFVFAVVHLSAAQLRRALALLPNLRALAPAGWTLFLWGIFGVVWYLFFGSQATPPRPPHAAVPWLLGAGGALAILFAHPSRNPAKTLGLGLASFPLAAIGTFSDTVSYIRLMAVGLASTIIAQTFNALGAKLAPAATWFAAAPVIVFGHAFNIAMCGIAVLAHGVRLNMLEFSNNAGVQWAGYPYEPFAAAESKEN